MSTSMPARFHQFAKGAKDRYILFPSRFRLVLKSHLHAASRNGIYSSTLTSKGLTDAQIQLISGHESKDFGGLPAICRWTPLTRLTRMRCRPLASEPQKDVPIQHICSTSLLMIAFVSVPLFAAGEDALAPCDAIAAQVKAKTVVLKVFEHLQPFNADDLLTPLINMSQPEPARDELFAKAAQLFDGEPDNQSFELQHVGGAVWRAYKVQGTAHCMDERFFVENQDGVLSVIATPPTYGVLCWNGMRSVGTIAGKPALIEREYREQPFQGLDVEVTPWSAGWLPTCQVSIRFDDAFRVAERFCGSRSVCSEASTLAPKLALALARASDGKLLGTIAPPTPDEAKAFNAHLVAAQKSFKSNQSGHALLPTFGKTPRTEYPNYSDTYAVALVKIGGKIFLARVGTGGVGWRAIGDYLIAIYANDSPSVQPIASYVVQRQLTGLRSIEISVPSPYVRTQ